MPIQNAFSMFSTLIKHGFLTNQSTHRVLPIYILNIYNYYYITNMDVTNQKSLSEDYQLPSEDLPPDKLPLQVV